jgi:hypothetical protein
MWFSDLGCNTVHNLLRAGSPGITTGPSSLPFIKDSCDAKDSPAFCFVAPWQLAHSSRNTVNAARMVASAPWHGAHAKPIDPTNAQAALSNVLDHAALIRSAWMNPLTPPRAPVWAGRLADTGA